MKSGIMLLCIGLSSSILFAQNQPAAQGPQGPRAMVFPFLANDSGGNSAGIGQTVQQSLMTELSKFNVQVMAGDTPVTDPAQAVQIGKQAGAVVVIVGNYQVIDSDVRFTGQAVDVASGQPVAPLKATGSVRDLASMEQTLALQLKPLFVPPSQMEATAQAPAQPVQNDVAAIPAPPQAQPQQQLNSQPYNPPSAVPQGGYVTSSVSPPVYQPAAVQSAPAVVYSRSYYYPPATTYVYGSSYYPAYPRYYYTTPQVVVGGYGYYYPTHSSHIVVGPNIAISGSVHTGWSSGRYYYPQHSH